MNQHLQELHDQADEFINEWFMDQRYDIEDRPLAGCDRQTLREALVNLALKSQLAATENAKKIVGED